MSWINFTDIYHPILSYYISTSNTSPTELFGGTWEQIEGGLCLVSTGDYTWTSTDLFSVTKLATKAGSLGGCASIEYAQMPAHIGHLYSWGGNSTLYLPYGTLTSYGSTGRGWNVQAGNEAVPAGMNRGEGAIYLPKHYGVYVWRRVN